jgi:hypothetical protein
VSYPVTAIGPVAFEDCVGVTSVTIPLSVTNIGEDAFINCSGLTSVTIPNSVTVIQDWAFRLCTNLASVEIPHSVTSLGTGAFSSCTGLTSVTLSNSLTSIETGVFSDCGRLTSITIPHSVTSIGERAFMLCTGLTSITIPISVTSIGMEAFRSCRGLKDLSVSWPAPLSIAADVFTGLTLGEIILHVPEGTEAAYRAADTWKEFRVGGNPPDGTVSPEAQKVWSHKGVLYVHTPQAERIEIYALNGQRLYAARKDAGPAVFSLIAFPRGVLVVRSDGGWSEKVVNH